MITKKSRFSVVLVVSWPPSHSFTRISTRIYNDSFGEILEETRIFKRALEGDENFFFFLMIFHSYTHAVDPHVGLHISRRKIT